MNFTMACKYMHAYDFLVQIDNANIVHSGELIQNLGVTKLSSLSKLTPVQQK